MFNYLLFYKININVGKQRYIMYIINTHFIITYCTKYIFI